LEFKKMPARDASKFHFNYPSNTINYSGNRRCLARDSEGYLTIVFSDTGKKPTNCFTGILISESATQMSKYAGMAVKLPLDNVVLRLSSTGEIDTGQTRSTSSKAKTPLQNRSFNIKVVNGGSNSKSCKDKDPRANCPIELTLHLRNYTMESESYVSRSRLDSIDLNEHPEMCKANTEHILPTGNGMHTATSNLQIGTPLNQDTPIIYSNPTRNFCDQFGTVDLHNPLVFQGASVRGAPPGLTSINGPPSTGLAFDRGDYTPDAPAIPQSINNWISRPESGDQYPGYIAFPKLIYQSNPGNLEPDHFMNLSNRRERFSGGGEA
jgi:hypothetical protein